MSTCEVSKFEEGRDIVLLSTCLLLLPRFPRSYYSPTNGLCLKKKGFQVQIKLNMHKSIHIFHTINKDDCELKEWKKKWAENKFKMPQLFLNRRNDYLPSLDTIWFWLLLILSKMLVTRTHYKSLVYAIFRSNAHSQKNFLWNKQVYI